MMRVHGDVTSVPRRARGHGRVADGGRPRAIRAALGLSCAAFALLVGAPGWTQDPPSDEIIIQARKRAESLQRVPVSGSALTSEDIRDLGGIANSQDITQFFTGLITEAATDGGEFFLRFQGFGRGTLTKSTTAVLRDGVDITGGFNGRGFRRMDSFDAEQIEVYRGPQGALFGKNATGGVINYRIARPKEFFEYSGLVSWDFEREELRTEAIVNIPIIENRLFSRWAVQFEDDEGVYYNDVRDTPVNGQEVAHFRGSLKWLVNEAIDVTFMVDVQRDMEPEGLLNTEYYPDGPQRNSTVPPGTVPPAGAPPAGFYVDPDGNLVPHSTPLADRYHVTRDTKENIEARGFNAFLEINADLPFGVLSSSTNFRDVTDFTRTDDDQSYIGGPQLESNITSSDFFGGYQTNMAPSSNNSVTMVCETRHEAENIQLSQEFRLVSNDRSTLDIGGPLEWIAGADFKYFKNPLTRTRSGRDPLFNLMPSSFARNNTRETEQEDYLAGIYGTLSWTPEFGPAWFQDLDFAASGRYQVDRVSLYLHTFDDDRGGAETGVGQDGLSTWFHQFSPSLSIVYNYLPAHRVYLAWAQGTRTGAPSFASGTVGGASMNLAPVFADEEENNAYEIGLKGEFDLGRANRMDYSFTYFFQASDHFLLPVGQIQQLDEEGADGGQIVTDQLLDNVGDVHAHGFELDVNGRFPDVLDTGGTLTASGGLSFGEGDFVKVVPGYLTQVGPGTGFDEPRLFPRWTWRGNLTYRRAMPLLENTGLGLFANTNFSWTDGTIRGNKTQDETRVVNARLGLEGENYGTNWQFVFFANNVTNFGQPASQTPTAAVSFFKRSWRLPDPPTYGIRLSFRGGDGNN